MGKSLDSRMHDLSGTRVYKLGTADEAVGLESSVEPWIEGLYPVLEKVRLEARLG